MVVSCPLIHESKSFLYADCVDKLSLVDSGITHFHVVCSSSNDQWTVPLYSHQKYFFFQKATDLNSGQKMADIYKLAKFYYTFLLCQ